MKKKEWTDIPPDVHAGIRRARRFLRFLAWRLSDEERTDDNWYLIGLAMHCDNEADWLDALLADYGLPAELLPSLECDESEEERLERRLLRNRGHK